MSALPVVEQDREQVPAPRVGMVRIYEGADMMWWEEERLLTERDKAAIQAARKQAWTEIDEDTAETEIGRRWVHEIAMEKYHLDEYRSGME